ncbi:hypothetical protein FSARC_5485 [Fusarium sarcochroum]|uniref:Uncharacterized protein n=1 Tax=Fusarium sarcochroum TaxID=1208366 RepID=A0A8H4X9G9_9HYPO|nr:hypothetical protein FSARC_5485 [Fusarium sarcochroum]
MQFTISLSLLALLSAANAQGLVSFGPAFSLGPTKSWIREATTTLVLPKVPSPAKDRLALWPGMGTSGGDLIQALAVAFSDPNANCGAKDGQWCAWASTLQGEQLGGKQVPADAGDKLTMHYVYNDSTDKYDQTVTINGNVVSEISTSSGHAEGWGTAVECQDDACVGTVDAHEYLDTTIILNEADETFKDTLGLNEATSSGFSSSDGGKTWAVDKINIQAHTFDVTS